MQRALSDWLVVGPLRSIRQSQLAAETVFLYVLKGRWVIASVSIVAKTAINTFFTRLERQGRQ
jgi:hypothetical protein